MAGWGRKWGEGEAKAGHTHITTETTGRGTDRQTGRQTDRQVSKQKDNDVEIRKKQMY